MDRWPLLSHGDTFRHWTTHTVTLGRAGSMQGYWGRSLSVEMADWTKLLLKCACLHLRVLYNSKQSPNAAFSLRLLRKRISWWQMLSSSVLWQSHLPKSAEWLNGNKRRSPHPRVDADMPCIWGGTNWSRGAGFKSVNHWFKMHRHASQWGGKYLQDVCRKWRHWCAQSDLVGHVCVEFLLWNLVNEVQKLSEQPYRFLTRIERFLFLGPMFLPSADSHCVECTVSLQ